MEAEIFVCRIKNYNCLYRRYSPWTISQLLVKPVDLFRHLESMEWSFWWPMLFFLWSALLYNSLIFEQFLMYKTLICDFFDFCYVLVIRYKYNLIHFLMCIFSLFTMRGLCFMLWNLPPPPDPKLHLLFRIISYGL